MRVLVCGSRDWYDSFPVWTFLDGLVSRLEPEPLVVIQGEARRVDRIAAEWATVNAIRCMGYPPDWATYGKRAGNIRNQQMLDEGHPDLVLAFRSEGESPGTDMMIELARKANVPTYVIRRAS